MGVVAPTVMVMVELPLPGDGIVVGLNVTVVPVGVPEADRLIELVNPPLIVVVMVEVPWLPCAILRDDGEAEIAKLGPATTVSVRVVFCWMPPPSPVTVMGYVPVGVLPPTVMVMVELPSPGSGMVCGLKLTVVPVGMPEADKLTAPEMPLPTMTMLETPSWPWATVRVAGVAEIVKFGLIVAGSPCVVELPPVPQPEKSRSKKLRRVLASVLFHPHSIAASQS